jgi:kynureninase
VVTTAGEFDSVDFIVRAYAQAGRTNVDWVELGDEHGVPCVDPASVLAKVTDATDLVVVSHVLFGTGSVFAGLSEFVAACRRRGALVLVDVYHSAGAMPVDVSELAADFAIGGGYKYLRGGPGASWLYVAPDALKSSRKTLDTGWFAKAENFDYHRGDKIKRQPGIGSWAESTPPVIATYQARSGLEFTLELGVDRIRAYGIKRQALLRSTLSGAGVPVFEPSDPEAFGAFSLVPSDDAKQVCLRAAERGVAVDSRGRMIRLCPDVLNSVEEFEVAARILAECMR